MITDPIIDEINPHFAQSINMKFRPYKANCRRIIIANKI